MSANDADDKTLSKHLYRVLRRISIIAGEYPFSVTNVCCFVLFLYNNIVVCVTRISNRSISVFLFTFILFKGIVKL